MNKAENVNHLAQMPLNRIRTMAWQDFLGCDIHIELWLLLGAVGAVSSVSHGDAAVGTGELSHCSPLLHYSLRADLVYFLEWATGADLLQG